MKLSQEHPKNYSPSDFLAFFFFFLFFFLNPASLLLVLHILGTSVGLFCKSFMQETHYSLFTLPFSVLLLYYSCANWSGAEALRGRVVQWV